MVNMKVKLIIGDEIKGVFNNPILNTIPKERKDTSKQPLLKTSISHMIDIDTPYQSVNEMYNEAAMIRSKVIRSYNDAPQVIIPEEIQKCMNPQDEMTTCTSNLEDSDNTDSIDRATTEEEADVFDSIEAIDECNRTESEKAFMLLYADGFCPPLDELEKALIPIREERLAALQNEVAATSDQNYSNGGYTNRHFNDEETFEKMKSSNKKKIMDQY